jgi:hypothetical protein
MSDELMIGQAMNVNILFLFFLSKYEIMTF